MVLVTLVCYLRPRDTGAPPDEPPRVEGVLLPVVTRELLRENELPRLLGCALFVERVLLLRLGVE